MGKHSVSYGTPVIAERGRCERDGLQDSDEAVRAWSTRGVVNPVRATVPLGLS